MYFLIFTGNRVISENIIYRDHIIHSCLLPRVNEKIEEEYRKEREAKTSPSKSKKPARH